MQMQSVFFKKFKTNKGKRKTDHSTTQGKSIPALKQKTFKQCISNNKKEPLALGQVLLKREQHMACTVCGSAEVPE